VLGHAQLAWLATTRDGKGGEIQASRGMDNHELARLSWRSEPDPDRVLGVLVAACQFE
jgi:hypothetical protein